MTSSAFTSLDNCSFNSANGSSMCCGSSEASLGAPIKPSTISLENETVNSCIIEESIKLPILSRNDILMSTSSSGKSLVPASLITSKISIPGGDILTSLLKTVDIEVAAEP